MSINRKRCPADESEGLTRRAPRSLSEREASEFLAPISQRTLQDWRRKGCGPQFSRLGRRIAYDLVDLEAFKAAGRVEPKVVV
jgi:hypothetical protein